MGSDPTSPSGTRNQCRRMPTEETAMAAERTGDAVADAVAVGAGLGLGAAICGPHATKKTASAHTHDRYLEVMSLVPQRRWIIPRILSGDALDGIPSLVAQILRTRGLADGDMPAFLSPKLANDGPPMLDLDRAVGRQGARGRRRRASPRAGAPRRAPLRPQGG